MFFIYTEFDFDDEAFGMEDEESTIDCFFKVKVQNCMEGRNVSTFTREMIKVVVLDGEKTEVCLPAVCSSLSDGVKLVDDVAIGGPAVEATPYVLKMGMSRGIFNTESACMKSSVILSTVVCTEEGPGG